jgi:hypothetical protein
MVVLTAYYYDTRVQQLKNNKKQLIDAVAGLNLILIIPLFEFLLMSALNLQAIYTLKVQQ